MVKKFIENNLNIDYTNVSTNIIIEISINPEKEKYLKYTTNEDFFKKSTQDMDRITRNISGEAEVRYLNNEDFGVYIDYDGDSYYYDISSKDTYGITKVEKYNEIDMEVTNERIKNANS